MDQHDRFFIPVGGGAILEYNDRALANSIDVSKDGPNSAPRSLRGRLVAVRHDGRIARWRFDYGPGSREMLCDIGDISATP